MCKIAYLCIADAAAALFLSVIILVITTEMTISTGFYLSVGNVCCKLTSRVIMHSRVRFKLVFK